MRLVKTSLILAALLGALVLAPGSASAKKKPKPGAFVLTKIVADQAGVAAKTDSNLVNPWGMAFSPTGPFWLSANRTGVSTIYDGQGATQLAPVTIPGATAGTTGSPTGIVFNGTPDFVISNGTKSGKAIFIFATEDGTLSGWAFGVDRGKAFVAANQSASNAVYQGLAIGSLNGANFLYAADFRNGVVDVYDGTFQKKNSFTDTRLPKGYAPFAVAVMGNNLLVTFAKQDAARLDDIPGRGHGYVDLFDLSGKFIKRLISKGKLNSPWGLAVAPAGFGSFGGDLLVGNFGDGAVNAYSLKTSSKGTTAKFAGTMTGTDGKPLLIDGLWALAFGNGGAAGSPNSLYFTAGPNREVNGLFGQLDPAPK